MLELIVTMGLLVGGIVPVVSVMSSGLVADQTIERKTVALALAQEKIEQIKDAPNWAAVSGYASARSNMGGMFTLYDSEVTITGLAPDPGNLKQVTAVVYWQFKGSEEQVSLSTILTNSISDGSPLPSAPVADAGSAQTVNPGSQVSLSGLASTDADNDPLAYSWSAPSGIVLSSSTSATPTFTAPLSADTYTFTLTVADPGGLSSSASVDITVNSQALFKVTLQAVGPSKILVIKAIRNILFLTLTEAKNLCDTAPSVLKDGATQAEAEALKSAIETAGGTVGIE